MRFSIQTVGSTGISTLNSQLPTPHQREKMPAKTIMIQGTASDVGKSIIVTALCRIFSDEGYRVAPFKAQNMALNSYVTADGKEMGRAQAVQAEAARTTPVGAMNPILLKPTSDQNAQVVVDGRPIGDLSADAYYDRKKHLFGTVKKALAALRDEYELVIIEGAGSPVEVNLRDRDIVNMATAELADAQVLLVADIDRGGMFASIVGTMELLAPSERLRVRGIIVNKFRGRRQLLDPGLDFLEKKTGLPVLGVIPFLHGLAIEAEDSVCLERNGNNNKDKAEIEIAVIKLPHISNFTDFGSLGREPGVSFRFATKPAEIEGADAVIVPGTKATIKDLNFLEETRLAGKIVEMADAEMPIIGICGGLQLLGKRLTDVHLVESGIAEARGLGLLPLETNFGLIKKTTQSKASICGYGPFLTSLDGAEVAGYEIHMGESRLLDGGRPFSKLAGEDRFEGAVSDNGLVMGTYLHGIFDNDNFRRRFIDHLRERKGVSIDSGEFVNYQIGKDAEYDRLARIVRSEIDMELIYKILKISKAKV